MGGGERDGRGGMDGRGGRDVREKRDGRDGRDGRDERDGMYLIADHKVCVQYIYNHAYRMPHELCNALGILECDRESVKISNIQLSHCIEK